MPVYRGASLGAMIGNAGDGSSGSEPGTVRARPGMAAEVPL